MKPELIRRGGGRDREELAFATPMPRSSEAIKTRGKSTVDREQLGVKEASWTAAKIGEHST
jgi:hypothetical protein